MHGPIQPRVPIVTTADPVVGNETAVAYVLRSAHFAIAFVTISIILVRIPDLVCRKDTGRVVVPLVAAADVDHAAKVAIGVGRAVAWGHTSMFFISTLALLAVAIQPMRVKYRPQMPEHLKTC